MSLTCTVAAWTRRNSINYMGVNKTHEKEKALMINAQHCHMYDQGCSQGGQGVQMNPLSSQWPWIMYILNLEEYDLLVTGV